ncbi:MAG: FAD-dependent oxidoreductase [Spirochaetota bacterium]|nr:MAG: FAD-dependent oxidoreductase [Spirochaetota bacterium]
MSRVKIVLNGKETLAHPKETILEVARRNNLFIPTLCYDDRLEPYGACRVCLVKVEGAKTFLPSCSTKVTNGMVIDTENEEVKSERRLALSLLISDHYGDCDSPCSIECPANIDIQGYIALIAAGRYTEAVKLIKEKNPMPLTIGRICPRPCEAVCRRNRVDEPIAINFLKRYAADFDSTMGKPYIPERENSLGKRIAVIGAGPAGLTCAYYLAVMGYEVTIFEKELKAGGMLRYGIPQYRLPKEILDREIDTILRLGVNIEYSTELGKDISIEEIRKRNYTLVFIGIGAQCSTRMRIEGEDLDGVTSGLEFLHNIAEGVKPDLTGKRVVVIGGGNTAIDAARTSFRLGTGEVIILYRRTRLEMPANDFEIEEAIEEGIKLEYLSAPVRIKKEGQRLRVECIRMKLGEPDSSGRRRPVPVQGSNYILKADLLISAIGQKPDIPSLGKDLISAKDTLKADLDTGATDDSYLFSAGDCVTGAATAIEAIAGGRKAAYAMDRRIKGMKPVSGFTFNISRGALEEIPDSYFSHYKKSKRASMPTLHVSQRKRNFEEIEKGFTEDAAFQEARRCLECGCHEGFSCDLRDCCTLYNVPTNEFVYGTNILQGYDNLAANLPLIIKDENKCIKCGTCIRICDEVWGLSIWGWVNRGFETLVTPYFDLELKDTACDFCGQCADSCPTGALTLKPYLQKPGPFCSEQKVGICVGCSLGCEISYNIYENLLVRNRGKAGENEGNLCVRGRFGYNYLAEGSRSLSFLEVDRKKRKKLVEKDALDKVSDLLNRSKKIGIFTSTSLSNEEYKKVKELSSKFSGAELFHIPFDFAEDPQSQFQYSTISRSKKFNDLVNLTNSPSLSELDKASAIILLNILPARSYPILEMRIRNAVKKGTKLFIINRYPIRLDDVADSVFRIKTSYYKELLDIVGSALLRVTNDAPEDVTVYFNSITTNSVFSSAALIKYEKIMLLVSALSSSNKCVFIADENNIDESTLFSFVNLTLMMEDRSKLLLLNKGTNPKGALEHGMVHEKRTRITDKELKKFDTLLLYKLPQIFKLDGKAVVHLGFKPFSQYGNYGVFIPSSSLLETGGTTLLYNGKETDIPSVLNKNKKVDNLKFFSKILERTSYVSEIDPSDSGPQA